MSQALCIALQPRYNPPRLDFLRAIGTMRRQIAGYVFSGLIAAAITISCRALHPVLRETDTIMLFLVGAVVAAAWLGRGPALLYAVLSVSLFNYFFVEPLYSFDVSNTSYWLTFAVMFFACAVISTFAARLREQLGISHQREQHALFLFELTKKLSAATTAPEMVEAMRGCLTALNLRSGAAIADPKKTYTLDHTGAPATLDIEWPLDMPADKARTVETGISLLNTALARNLAGRTAEDAKLAAASEKLRSTLLSAVSHDMRTPLAAISGAAETLAARLGEEPLLQSICRESTRLTKLITNLLDVTRMEGGGIRLNMRAYAPAEIIGSAISASAQGLARHKLMLKVEDDLPFLRMDGLLISQLVQNLLENAAHHTPAGTEIELAAYMRDNSFCLVVADRGPGIPQGQEAAIFEKFVSHGDAGSDKKGTGLGLAICQSITLAHGGRIYAQNRSEGGARFVVELPPSLTLSPLETKAEAQDAG